MEKLINKTLAIFTNENLTFEDLKGTSRKREVVITRQCVMYVLAQFCFTRETIGALFNRHHSTVTHSIQMVETYWNQYFFIDYKRLIEKALKNYDT